MAKYHPVEVMGVRVEMPSNQPIVLLKETDGVRYLPIWLGAVEATAIAFAQQEVIPPRPLTHDLFKDVLGQLGAKLKTVYLTELKDGIFYAQLNFEDGPAISARPSDAIALAIGKVWTEVEGSLATLQGESLTDGSLVVSGESNDELAQRRKLKGA